MQKFGFSESVYKTYKNLLLQNYLTKFLDIALAHKYPLVCVIKICSNGGPTYIIGEIIAKDNLYKTNLMQTLKSPSSKLLDRILRYCTQILLGYV